MAIRELSSHIFSIGAIDWDRTLFDALVPLPHGTSYNAYLVQGSEKTALIDTVEPGKFDQLKMNLAESGVTRIDYIISNHAEQDHSGSLPEILEMFPMATVVTNTKCRDLLVSFLSVPEDKFQVISDGETLSLGDKTLRFIFAPWVHWPETMLTWIQEDRILFSCDLFGSHLASSRLFANNSSIVLTEAKRYYAEIMMPFAKSISKHLDKIDELKPAMVAPSHGPVYENPAFILDAYRSWVSDMVTNEVVILYVSMHGSTENMVSRFSDMLMKRKIQVKPFNLVSADIGEIALALVDAATVVVASPAFLIGPHPLIVYAASVANSLKPKTKFAAVIGSYGWGNKLVDQTSNLLSSLKAEFLPPVLTKGFPKEDDLTSLEQLADQILDKHRSIMPGAK